METGSEILVCLAFTHYKEVAILRGIEGGALLEPSLEAKEFPHCYKTMDNLVLKRRFVNKIYTNLQQTNQIAPGS